MKVLKNKRNEFTVSLELEADYAEIEKATEPAFKELVKDAKVPGFRPGKVTRPIFEQYYGKEMLIQRASTIVMNETYRQAIEAEKISPVDFPQNVEVKTFEPGKPFVFTLTVEVKPEVKLHKYKGIKVTKDDATVSEEDVNKEIERMREYSAEYKVADRAVKNDDLVAYAIKAFDGETPVEEWTKERSGTRVGANFISEDFDKALLGMKLNETKSFTAKIKADYFVKSVAGKDIKFEVLITEIKERALPEVNDEFAKKVYGKDTVAEMKAELKANLEKHKSEEVENKFRNDLVEELVKENDLKIPQALTNEKLEQMLRGLEGDLRQRKMEINKYLEIMGKTMEQLRAEYLPVAEKRAKLELILEAIAEKEEIKPTEEEYLAEIKKIFKGNKEEEPKQEDMDKLKASLPESTKKYIEKYLTDEKVNQFIIDNAKIK